MNSEPSPEIFELARSEAIGVVGEADSTEQLVDAISELAQRDPRQARQTIETVAAHLDEATEGKRTEELEQLEAAALEALGLDAKSMVAIHEAGGEGSKEPPFA